MTATLNGVSLVSLNCVKMSDEEKAIQEKKLGQEAHKRKEYEIAISHYSNAMRLNSKEMSILLKVLLYL